MARQYRARRNNLAPARFAVVDRL